MEVILASVSDDLADAWRRFCGGYPGVRVHDGSILDVECDAVVSPANSFGFMDGGIDALYLKRFGSARQEAVQTMLARLRRLLRCEESPDVCQAIAESQHRREAAVAKTCLPVTKIDTTAQDWQTYANTIVEIWKSKK